MIKTILTKLEKLKTLDSKFSIFGADSHKYILEPKLSEDEIVKFEQENKINLPDEYRQFLMHAYNGGAGPFYGMLNLDSEENNKKYLPEEFPFDFNNPFSIFDLMDDAPEDDDENEAFWDEINKQACSGIIFLAHEGCGMFSVLVVKGKEYGNVWFFDLANDAGVFPLANSLGKPMGFYEWYNIWLDSAVNELENGVDSLQSYSDFIPES